MIFLNLFTAFFKTGLFAVGGGLATLPFLYEISDRTHWFTHGDIADIPTPVIPRAASREASSQRSGSRCPRSSSS